MPQDKDKQRGKTTVVDGETPGASGGQQSAPRKLTAVACIDCRKRKRKVNNNLYPTIFARLVRVADKCSNPVQWRATFMLCLSNSRTVMHV